ncbi:MAG: hypothetical protein IT462_10125 [Planctomycetes bacterium]|nr:hypothetical protein [Planctomycetota bacterium]
MKYLLLLAAMMFCISPLMAQDEPETTCENIEEIIEAIEVELEITDADVDAAIEAIKDGSLDKMIKDLETLGMPEDLIEGLKKLKDVDTSDKAAVKKLLEEIGMKFAGEAIEAIEGVEAIEECEKVESVKGEMVIMLQDGTKVTLKLDEKGEINKDDLDKLTEEQRKEIEDILAMLEDAEKVEGGAKAVRKVVKEEKKVEEKKVEEKKDEGTK